MTLLDPRIPATTPTGTRDLLPEELRELRGITRTIEDCFAAEGYGEVRTPTLEVEASEGSDLAAYRFIDEQGNTLVLRSDMTVPIARVALTRFSESSEPLKLSYLERSWRRVKSHSGEGREILQAGAELIGAGEAGPQQIVELCARVLISSGLRDWKLAIGDAVILDSALRGVDVTIASQIRQAVVDQDLVAVDRLAAEAGAPRIAKIVRFRCDANQFDTSWIESEVDEGSVDGIRRLLEGIEPDIRDRVIVDFGLSSDLDYYSGVVFAIYDPAVGRALGSGGSYDSLFESSGSDLTGIGFAIDVDLLHQAIAGEERGESLPNG